MFDERRKCLHANTLVYVGKLNDSSLNLMDAFVGVYDDRTYICKMDHGFGLLMEIMHV